MRAASGRLSQNQRDAQGDQQVHLGWLGGSIWSRNTGVGSTLGVNLWRTHARGHRAAHQVLRYKRLGATGLTELYDRTLPREVNRMLKPFGTACEMLGVFVPTNFSIKRSESGYDVYSSENELLGTAPTLEETREFVPDGGHELLYDVHGVRLPAGIRRAMPETGFPAWG